MTAELTIRSVRQVGDYDVITDSSGVEHATKNHYYASIAKTCAKEKCGVRIGSNAGGRWRNLYAIKPQK